MPVLVRKNINIRDKSLLYLMSSTDFAVKPKLQAEILGAVSDIGLILYKELTGPEKKKISSMDDDDLERLLLRAARRLQDKRSQ